MKLIKPSEISARILTLLEESDKRIILVSPYMKISKWYKLVNKINELIARRILIEIYVRDDPENTATYRDLDQLDLQYRKIPHLHSKFYMNEKYGIVTSMNLLLSSEFNSLEIGYATETSEEYNDLIGYYHRYIHLGESIHCESAAGHSAVDLREFMQCIGEELNRTVKNSWLWLAENALHISTGKNNYIVSVNNGYLNIIVSLRIAPGTKLVSVQDSIFIGDKIRDLTSMKVVTQPGPLHGNLQLTGQAPHILQSNCITAILANEQTYLIESVIRFVDATDNLVI